jgi:hypothetical protein
MITVRWMQIAADVWRQIVVDGGSWRLMAWWQMIGVKWMHMAADGG